MKTDFRKSISSYKARRGRFDIVEIPSLKYLMIDGSGDPNTSVDYKNAIEALYPLAYKLKFASKTLGRDYVVMPLESLWWSDNMTSFTTKRNKSEWHWTAMIMQPDWITEEMLNTVKETIVPKDRPLAIDKVRLATLSEGLCVQTLHVGSFEDETPVLKAMHEDFIPDNHLKMVKKHHEIYFSDFRKTEASKLKTILRQPVQKD